MNLANQIEEMNNAISSVVHYDAPWIPIIFLVLVVVGFLLWAIPWAKRHGGGRKF